MVLDKDNIPFFNDLENTNKKVKLNGNIYDLYSAPTWELSQRVDSLMENDSLGYDIDDYLIDEDISI